jgi:hypothetical protein
LVELVDGLPDDRLCMVGVALEPLLDIHTDLVVDAFEEALRHHANLRKALSCAWLHIDEGIAERLTGYIRAEEHLGKQPGTRDSSVEQWRSARDEPIRDVRVRVRELVTFLASAAKTGLENSVDRGAVERAADPGAAHFVWPRFHCTRDVQLPFYRCGLRLGRGVCELDLLEADVRSLPESDPWRVAAWLRIEMERLPNIEEL